MVDCLAVITRGPEQFHIGLKLPTRTYSSMTQFRREGASQIRLATLIPPTAEHTASRSGTNDDIIELIHEPLPLYVST